MPYVNVSKLCIVQPRFSELRLTEPFGYPNIGQSLIHMGVKAHLQDKSYKPGTRVGFLIRRSIL